MRSTDTLLYTYNILWTYSLICRCTLIFTHAYFVDAHHNIIILLAYCALSYASFAHQFTENLCDNILLLYRITPA